jgi:hypothetical protein
MPDIHYKGKYSQIKKQSKILNRYGAYLTNAVTHAADTTEMGVPIPDDESVSSARAWQQENEK